MRPGRAQGGGLRGPIVFWSLVLLVILAVYAGFRAISPRRAAAVQPEVRAAGPPPARAAKATAATPAWGGKPLRVKTTTASVVVPLPTGTEPAANGVGLTPEEVAARIRQGRPALVLFFSTDSSRSREMFPQFVRLAQSPESPGVLAFSTDQDATAVDTFLRVNGAGFDAPLLLPSKPGELSAALAEVGLKIGKQLDTPFVAVVGRGGEILGQWPGIADLAPVVAVLATAKEQEQARE